MHLHQDQCLNMTHPRRRCVHPPDPPDQGRFWVHCEKRTWLHRANKGEFESYSIEELQQNELSTIRWQHIKTRSLRQLCKKNRRLRRQKGVNFRKFWGGHIGQNGLGGQLRGGPCWRERAGGPVTPPGNAQKNLTKNIDF